MANWWSHLVFFLSGSVLLITLYIVVISRLSNIGETTDYHASDEMLIELARELKSLEDGLVEGLTNWEYRLINLEATNGYDTSVLQYLMQVLSDLEENLPLTRGEALMERESVKVIDKLLLDFEQHVGKLQILDSLLMIKMQRKYSQVGMENALPWLRGTSPPPGRTWRSLLDHIPRGLNMVFFNNYNFVTFRQTLASVTTSVAYSFLDRFHQCVFVLGRPGQTGKKETVRKTLEVINHVRFCKKTILRIDVENMHPTDSFTTWRAVMDRIFGKYNSKGIANQKAFFDNYEGDVLVFDEGVILSEDGLEVALFASLVKNTVSGIWQFALAAGGHESKNSINAHPDTFIVRKSGTFLRSAYGLNRSTWFMMSAQLNMEHFERENEWNVNLGKMIVKYNEMRAFHVVVPTLARSHMMTNNEKIPWFLATRAIDTNSVTVSKGVRDIYGFLCDPRLLVPAEQAEEAECACSSRKWNSQLSKKMYCCEQPFQAQDKCFSDKYLELY